MSKFEESDDKCQLMFCIIRRCVQIGYLKWLKAGTIRNRFMIWIGHLFTDSMRSK